MGYRWGEIKRIARLLCVGGFVSRALFMASDSRVDRFELGQFTWEELRPFMKCKEVEGYCRNCEKYGLSWSCPPHAFDPEAWLAQHRFVCLIGRVMYVDSAWSEKEGLERYFEMTRRLNDATRGLEELREGAVCLYAGQCDYCEPCARGEGEACRAPQLCRYSLESLGFKVSDVMSELLQLPLQWSDGALPERFIAVSALLSADAFDLDEVKVCMKRAFDYKLMNPSTRPNESR